MNRFVIPTLALLPLLAACGDKDGDDSGGEYACTDDLRVSLSVRLRDDAGNAVSGADVTYAVDGGAAKDCEEWGGDWACGFEEAGSLEISVVAEGFEPHSEVVQIEADQCHVISQTLDVTLQSKDCTDVEVPAVIARVKDSQGVDVEDATLEWSYTDKEIAPQPCEHSGGNEYTCGWEISGELIIDARHESYEPDQHTVTVGHDGCHSITETIDMVLNYGDD